MTDDRFTVETCRRRQAGTARPPHGPRDAGASGRRRRAGRQSTACRELPARSRIGDHRRRRGHEPVRGAAPAPVDRRAAGGAAGFTRGAWRRSVCGTGRGRPPSSTRGEVCCVDGRDGRGNRRRQPHHRGRIGAGDGRRRHHARARSGPHPWAQGLQGVPRRRRRPAAQDRGRARTWSPTSCCFRRCGPSIPRPPRYRGRPRPTPRCEVCDGPTRARLRARDTEWDGMFR